MLKTNILVLQKLTVEHAKDLCFISTTFNDKSQAKDCYLFLYAYDSYLVYQHKDV